MEPASKGRNRFFGSVSPFRIGAARNLAASHDLRHTAVSRMLNAGVPIAKVAKIVGWSASTMVLMAKRYSHFALNDLRDAVESISNGKIDAGSPVSSAVSFWEQLKRRALTD